MIVGKNAAGAHHGGLLQITEEMGSPPPHWAVYFTTCDIAASTARVVQLGGAIHKEATAIPKVGRFSVVADKQGAVFVLFQSASPLD